jgi:LysM repeat protein
VRKGDTVASVAENFGVPEKMVRTWNHLKGNGLTGRKVLSIHLPVTLPVSSGKGEPQVASRHSGNSKHLRTQPVPTNAVLHHRVRAGETFYSIASSYNTTVSALKHDNRNVASLRPGMILVVHNPR